MYRIRRSSSYRRSPWRHLLGEYLLQTQIDLHSEAIQQTIDRVYDRRMFSSRFRHRFALVEDAHHHISSLRCCSVHVDSPLFPWRISNSSTRFESKIYKVRSDERDIIRSFLSSLLNNDNERIFSISVSSLFSKSSNTFQMTIHRAFLYWRWKNTMFLLLMLLHSSTNNRLCRCRLDIVNIREIYLLVIQNC